MYPQLKAYSFLSLAFSCLFFSSLASFAQNSSSSQAIRSGFNSNTLPSNDDGSTGLVSLNFPLNFFGRTYNGLYINNNGNVTFGRALAEYTPFGLTTNTDVPIIAPFFADVDTRGVGSGILTYGYGNGTVDGHVAFGVNWINVGYFSGHTEKLNSFQLIIIDRSDTGAGNFDFEFNYSKVLWETGDASGGRGGLGGSSSRVGYSNGSGQPGTFFELAGSGVNGALLDTGVFALIADSSGTDVLGRYIFKVRNGDVIDPPGTDYKLYRANLHSHTSYSDGGNPLIPDTYVPLLALTSGHENGLNVMATTDHAEQLSAEEWSSTFNQAILTTSGDFVALRGFEWTNTTSQGGWADISNLFNVPIPTYFGQGSGHMNVFGSLDRVGAYTDFTKPDQFPVGVPLALQRDDLWQWIIGNQFRSQDEKSIVAQFNHPTAYDNSNHFDDFSLPTDYRGPKLRDVVALMEVGSHANGGYEGESYNNEPPTLINKNKSNEYWFRKALQNGWRVAPTINEDNHLGGYGKDHQHTGIYAGRMPLSPGASQSAILDALRARRVFASEDYDGEVTLKASIGNELDRHWMGELLEVPRGSSVTFYIESKDPARPFDLLNPRDYIQQVELIGPGGSTIAPSPWNPIGQQRSIFAAQFTISQDEMDRLPKTNTGELFFYIKVTQADNDLLFSAPIWIKGPKLKLLEFNVTRDISNNVIISTRVANSGNYMMTDLKINNAVLGGIRTMSPLPVSLGNLPVGAGTTARMNFGNLRAGIYDLQLFTSYAGNTVAFRQRVTVP